MAWFGGWAYWAATRIWLPLDVPISLSPGHIRTPEFKINVKSTYLIRIEVEREFDIEGGPCIAGFRCPWALATSWSLSSGGRVTAHGNNNPSGRILGGFNAGAGNYVLDLDVWQDGSRLNAGAPRLTVFETGSAHANRDAQVVDAFVLFLCFALVGAYLVIRTAIVRRRAKRDEFSEACSLTLPGPQPRELQIDSQPLVLPPSQTGFRPPAGVCVGAFLLLAGSSVYACIHHWVATRTFVAVDIPVTLGPGHLTTGPFLVSPKEQYTMVVDTDDNRPHNASCLEYEALDTRWVLYKDGQVAAGSTAGGYLGRFCGKRGVYNLDVEVLRDASCLNSAHPRLRVSTDASAYADFYGWLSWLCATCVGVGVSLLALAVMGRFRKAPALATPSVDARTVAGHYHWKPRPSHRPIFSGMPSFGLIAAITDLAVMLAVFAIHFGLFLPPTGLVVHVLRPGIPAQSSPWMEPLRVRVDLAGKNARPNLYLNSQPISWEGLGAALAKDLKRRPPRFPVYVEGDPDLDWQHVVKAIDIIRGLQAEVVLFTAKRESPRRQSGSRTTPHPAKTLGR